MPADAAMSIRSGGRLGAHARREALGEQRPENRRRQHHDEDRVEDAGVEQVGDVGALWRSRGLWTVVPRILGNPNFASGIVAMAAAFFSLLFAPG